MLTGEEAEEGAALEGDLVADGAAQHGVGGFEGVEGGADGGRGGDFDVYFVAGDAGEGAEVGGEFNADGGHEGELGCGIGNSIGKFERKKQVLTG